MKSNWFLPLNIFTNLKIKKATSKKFMRGYRKNRKTKGTNKNLKRSTCLSHVVPFHPKGNKLMLEPCELQFLDCRTIDNMTIWTLAIVAFLLICIIDAWNLPSLRYCALNYIPKRLLSIFVAFYRKSTNDLESEAHSYLVELDQLSSQKCYESSVAEWAYATDINDENEKVKLELSLDSAKFSKEISQNVTATFPLWREFKDPDLVRKLKKITILGAARLPDDQFKKVNI